MVDVFISYSRSDHAFVAILARAVEAEGYEVWWDVELPPHQSYGDVITAKIAEAKAAIVVWSADAVKSEWVRAEADMARNQRKLVQTALNNIMPPLPFNQIQYAEMSAWQGEAEHPSWRKVKVSLAELCGTPPEDAPRIPTASPPQSHAPASTPAPAVAKWQIFAGVAIAAVALAAAGGMMLGRSGSTSAAAPAPAAAPETTQDARAPALVATPPIPAPLVAPGEPRAASRVDMTFPDSSKRLLTDGDVATLGPSTLRIARNEIYARLGRRFADPELRAYFSQFPWYRPTADQVTLNSVEARNVALLQQAEARYQ